MPSLFIFTLVVFLAYGIDAFDSHKKKADDEQEFRMSQDPEYRKFIEEKRAVEKKRSLRRLMLVIVSMIILFGLIIWRLSYY